MGLDADYDATIAAIFDVPAEDAPGTLRAILRGLGVATDPTTYGIYTAEWREIVTTAIDGPRGRNFIGTAGRLSQMLYASHRHIP